MGNDQPALRALFACESGLSELEIGLDHVFVLLIWKMKHNKWVKWQNSHGARCAKTTANCSNSFCHFHLILSGELASTAFDLKWQLGLTMSIILCRASIVLQHWFNSKSIC
jgi:hypothetical protein